MKTDEASCSHYPDERAAPVSRFIKTFSERLSLLRRLPPRIRVIALGEALAVASPPEAERLTAELLDLAVVPIFARPTWTVRLGSLLARDSIGEESAADLALAQIARSWRQVPPGCAQAALAVGDERWVQVVQRLSTDPSGPVRRSLAAFLADAGDTRLAGIAAGMLHDQDPTVGEAAERALVLLAVAAAREQALRSEAGETFISRVPPDGVMLAASRGLRGTVDELLGHVAGAALTFGEHRRRGPVIAAILIAERELTRPDRPGVRAIRNWLSSTQHPSHSVLRSVLRWSKAPMARLRALEWLPRDGLAVACADRLSRGRSLFEHELVLARAHLLARPRRAMRLQGVKMVLPSRQGKRRETEETVPPAAGLRRLSPGARRGLPHLLAAWGAPSQVRCSTLDALLADTEAAVRYAAMRAAPQALLTEFALDSDERVARGALLRRGGLTGESPDPHTLRCTTYLQRSQSALLRTWAKQDPQVCAQSVDSLTARLAARREMARDRGAFVAQLRAGLGGRGVDQVMHTLSQVRVLGLAHQFGPELLGLAAGSGDARVIATALSLVNQVSGERSAEVAHARLTHPDGRVRANAVEVLGRLDRQSRTVPKAAAAMIESKHDEHHRVRANALRLWFTRDDVEGLAEMLADARPLHRLAGLWAAQRLLPSGPRRFEDRWPEFGARIGELARFDEDHRVKARAAACVQMLTAQLRRGWVEVAR